jgi:aspartyl-tRNA(Asn)/glutamyl-tRNA(Gln) amidotransferase subunit C
MKLTDEEVKYLENLAKIKLSDDKKEKFANEIGEILGYVADVQNIDLDAPEVQALNGVPTSVYREDSTVGADVNHKEAAFKNAPNHEADYFKVSKVIRN